MPKFSMSVPLEIVLVFCISCATANSEQNYFNIMEGYNVINVLHQFEGISLKECATRCMSFKRNDSCDLIGYNTDSRTCQIAADNATASSSESQSLVLKILNMCGPSGAPENGSAVVSNGRTIATFTCYPGYPLVGSSSITCVDGDWNGIVPTCQDIDECVSSPCMNGANCINQINNYNCDCSSGWTGVSCETELDECTSVPCKNGGTCQDLLNDFSCTCSAGFTGKTCDRDIDECASNPCQNGGFCADGINIYTCTCVDGFAGVHCETDLNECSSTPCQNGGTCTDGINLYLCACVPGFTGIDCQTDINECLTSPCLNGATCVDAINSYTCSCPPVFTGVHCERDCYPTTPWEYNGVRDTTVDGTPCQRWDSQIPHPHEHTDLQWFPDTSLNAAKNYCRNPEPGEYDPWCMTSDPNIEWEYCGILKC